VATWAPVSSGVPGGSAGVCTTKLTSGSPRSLRRRRTRRHSRIQRPRKPPAATAPSLAVVREAPPAPFVRRSSFDRSCAPTPLRIRTYTVPADRSGHAYRLVRTGRTPSIDAPETVLVTGGTGFLGSYVAADLLDHGHEVVAFDLSADDRILAKLDVAAVQIRRGDVTDPTEVVRAVRETGASRVVHLAALLTDAARDDPRAAMEVNAAGTNNVFEAARTLDDQVERVAWASSAAVYAPPHRYDLPVDEEDLVRPDTLYGATKEYNEHQARVYAEDYDLSLVGLRPTVAYGPYRETGGSAFLANIVEKPALGEPFSVEYGDQAVDWQHARDIAQAFRKTAFAPEAGLSRRVYNVAGELATIREAVQVVRSILPYADLEVFDEGELPWTQDLDTSGAEADLGYQPEYDLETGFRQCANVLRAEHRLEAV